MIGSPCFYNSHPMHQRSSVPVSELPRLAILIVIAAAHFAVVSALTWPGFASFDTAYQWWMARQWDISTLWPPSYIISFRLLDVMQPALTAPTAWYVFNLALINLGALLVAFSCARTLAGTLACYVAIVGSPVAWLLMPHIWSDVALVSLLLVSTGAMMLGSRLERSTVVRRSILAASLFGLFAAVGVRHNAVVAVFPLTALWFAVANDATINLRRNLSLMVIYGAIVTSLFAAMHLAVSRWVATVRADNWAITAIWDLQALSVATGQNLVPKSISTNTDVADLRASFDPTNAVSLYANSRAQWANSTTGLTQLQAIELASAWRSAVLTHPGHYLSHRSGVMTALLGVHYGGRQGTRVEPVQTQFRDNPPRQFWWEAGVDLWRRIAVVMGSMWIASPVAAMAIAALVLGAGVMRSRLDARIGISADSAFDRRQKLMFATAITASGLFYLAGLFFTAPAGDMRFAFWPVIALVLAAIFTSTTRSVGATVSAAPS